MNLILVRHGETDWNTARRYQGQLDIPLNSTGEWQARQVAQALSSMELGRIISSDLRRALDTAEAIASACGVLLTTDSRLREISFGAWEGLNFDEIMEQDGDAYRRWKDNPYAYAPTGGETLDATGRRVISAWQEIKETAAQTIVLVSHGGTLRILLSHLLQLPPGSFWQIRLDNASLSRVQINHSQATLLSINDMRHLQEDSKEA